MYVYRLHTISISDFEVRLNFKQMVSLFLLLHWLKPVCGNATVTGYSCDYYYGRCCLCIVCNCCCCYYCCYYYSCCCCCYYCCCRCCSWCWCHTLQVTLAAEEAEDIEPRWQWLLFTFLLSHSRTHINVLIIYICMCICSWVCVYVRTM